MGTVRMREHCTYFEHDLTQMVPVSTVIRCERSCMWEKFVKQTRFMVHADVAFPRSVHVCAGFVL